MTKRMTKTDVLGGINLVTSGPSTQIDAALKTILYLANEDRDADELRRILHAALDYTIHGALAPGLVVRLLRQMWQDMGGTPEDIPVHREDKRIVQRAGPHGLHPGDPFQIRYRTGFDFALHYKAPLLAGTLHEAVDQEDKLHLVANENMHPLHALERLADEGSP